MMIRSVANYHTVCMGNQNKKDDETATKDEKNRPKWDLFSDIMLNFVARQMPVAMSET